MNNKKLGNTFENEFLETLGNLGFWATFIPPDNAGNQPFDIIAVKDGEPWAFDCKTCEKTTFTLNRLEVNQVFAFRLIRNRGGCQYTYIAVKHNGEIYLIDFEQLILERSVKLDEHYMLRKVIH